MSVSHAAIETALQNAEETYRGSGGAIAVVHNGEVFRRAWGFADMDRRIEMTSKTHLPICSISKQMVCLALIDLIRHPTPAMHGDPRQLLDQELRNMLPQLAKVKEGPPTLADLYNMQSGIRDYWAMTTLWGSKPDDPFSLAIDAPKALERTNSLHFEPGTESSYSNVNFYVVARVMEKVSGQSLGQLLAERVFIKAGMSTASLNPNTFAHPLPCVGYEGDEKHGYIPATNRIEWSGDAGIVASLEDMIAYEKWLHESWKDSHSIYREVARDPIYKDGSPAYYGYGLGHGEIAGKKWIGHGGALRGFRLQRLHVPSDHLSVVVLFNHEADSGAAAEGITKALFSSEEFDESSTVASGSWQGSFLDEETQLLIRVKPVDPGEVAIEYFAEEKIKLTDPTHGQSRRMIASIDHDSINIHRLREHRKLHGRRIAEKPDRPLSVDFVGEYHCKHASSVLRCTGQGKLMYGSFDGYLGKGPVHLMRYVGEDIWLLACPRGLDAPAPGDWTVVFKRDGNGKVVGATVGCWLARRLEFVKTPH